MEAMQLLARAATFVMLAFTGGMVIIDRHALWWSVPVTLIAGAVWAFSAHRNGDLRLGRRRLR